jgi:hypothetical protein
MKGYMKLTKLVLCPFALSLALGGKANVTLDGQIMDRQCAQMHSHDNMMKAEGATNEKECTVACVKNGDKFALLDSITNTVYLIDNDKKVRSFAGQRVHISGSYDKDSEVLEIATILAAK